MGVCTGCYGGGSGPNGPGEGGLRKKGKGA